VKAIGQQLAQSLQGAGTAFVRGELERLDGRRAELEARLGELNAQLAALVGQEAAPEIVNKELTILDNIWENLFPGEQQRLVRMVIDRATIFTDRLDLTLSGEGVQAVVDLLVAEHTGQGAVPASGAAGQIHTISLPIQFKRRAGRREIILPADGKTAASAVPNHVFLLTLARAFRWKDLLETGKFPTVKALAEAVGLERSYVGKLLNLTLLAPKIVEALVAGDEPDGLAVMRLRQGVPVRWEEQPSSAHRSDLCSNH
jgi:hypothetical protein